MDQHCENIVELEEDNGERGWSVELKVEQRRVGAGRVSGDNRWLKEDGGASKETGSGGAQRKHENPENNSNHNHSKFSGLDSAGVRN